MGYGISHQAMIKPVKLGSNGWELKPPWELKHLCT